VSLVDWGVSCSLVFSALVVWGFIVKRPLVGCYGGLLLAGGDFLRGCLARGGGYWPSEHLWVCWPFSWVVPVACGLAVLYLSWAFYPFVLVAVGVRMRSWLLIGSVIMIAALASWLIPVEPPWRTGAAVRAADVLPIFGGIVGADVSASAAFPSVHVAIPVVLALSERSRNWGLYSVLVSVVVVLAGEHWVLDVVGGVGLALAVWAVMVWAFQLWSTGSRAWSWFVGNVEDGTLSNGGGVLVAARRVHTSGSVLRNGRR
jgi:hypothetical protein